MSRETTAEQEGDGAGLLREWLAMFDRRSYVWVNGEQVESPRAGEWSTFDLFARTRRFLGEP